MDSVVQEGEGRQDHWNTVVGAVKANLPTMLQTVATPRKMRRIPDTQDPDSKAGPIRLPLHPTIKAALDGCKKEIKVSQGADMASQPKVNPDRQAPARYFRPEGAGSFLDPATLDSTVKDLHKGALPSSPHPFTTPESELKDREQQLRTLLCIESVKRWLEDAAIEIAEVMEKKPELYEWGHSLAEILGTVRSLSTLGLDRLTTDLTNVLLRRRDMWLRALDPRPNQAMLEHLRTADLHTPFLFGDLQPDRVERELARRKEAR